MTSILDPLAEATWVYQHREQYDRQQIFDAAASLSQWRLFSLRQIGSITGLSHSTVRKVAGSKSEKTGGKFAPESLEPLSELRRRAAHGDELDPAHIRDAIDAGAGTSLGFAARLTGISESVLRRKYMKSGEE